MISKKWFKQRSVTDNVIAVMKNFIYYLKVPVTKETIENELGSHAQYPGMEAISDVLDKWQITNKTFKIPKERIREIDFPAIAYLQHNKTFVMLDSCKRDNVNYIETEKGWQNESLTDFFKKWDGTVLIAMTTEESGEKDYKENRLTGSLTRIRNVSIIVLAFLIASFLLFKDFSLENHFLSFVTILTLKFIGIALSVILMNIEFFKTPHFISRICQHGNSFNCKAVLKTNISGLWGIISLAELGFFYFTGSFIILLCSPLIGLYPSSVSVLALLNIPILVASVLLIFTQAVIIKKWCLFCTSIQALFWIEFVFYLKKATYHFDFNLSLFVFCVACFLLPVTFWYIYKSRRILLKENDQNRRTLNLFEQNSTVLKSLLKTYPPLNEIEVKNEFIIGNLKSKITIIFILSPFCKYCESTFHDLLIIWKKFENLKIIIRFSIDHKYNDLSCEMIEHVLYLYNSGETELSLNAIKAWYSIKNKNERNCYIWKNKFPLNKPTGYDSINHVINQNSKWINDLPIFFTPMIIVTNNILPPFIRPYSIIYFIKNYFSQLQSNSKDYLMDEKIIIEN